MPPKRPPALRELRRRARRPRRSRGERRELLRSARRASSAAGGDRPPLVRRARLTAATSSARRTPSKHRRQLAAAAASRSARLAGAAAPRSAAARAGARRRAPARRRGRGHVGRQRAQPAFRGEGGFYNFGGAQIAMSDVDLHPRAASSRSRRGRARRCSRRSRPTRRTRWATPSSSNSCSRASPTGSSSRATSTATSAARGSTTSVVREATALRPAAVQGVRAGTRCRATVWPRAPGTIPNARAARGPDALVAVQSRSGAALRELAARIAAVFQDRHRRRGERRVVPGAQGGRAGGSVSERLPCRAYLAAARRHSATRAASASRLILEMGARLIGGTRCASTR